ncbi:alpha/beta fold hydrolase, partial [Candidatus Cloacimonadota bacterium]
WLLILLMTLFAVALFAGGSYVQGILLCGVIIVLIYWPRKYLFRVFGKGPSRVLRLIVIIMLFIPLIIINKNSPKTSIYKTGAGQEEIYNIYNDKMEDWSHDYLDIYVETTYGTVHVVAVGDENKKPILLLHAASMGAHSWAENLPPLINDYRIYAIDNPGEGNKSQLNNALEFPRTPEEISRLYASICDSLHIASSPVIAASNGGFLAMNYAYYNPERVESLTLLGPMGIMPLSGGSIFMMSIASMYPFQWIYDKTRLWALGSDGYVNSKYGDWFEAILKHTVPSLAAPVPMTTEQKQKMDLPILLILGTKDPLVGDADTAAEVAREFPNIRIEILDSSHIIGVEKAEIVNEMIGEFLETGGR